MANYFGRTFFRSQAAAGILQHQGDRGKKLLLGDILAPFQALQGSLVHRPSLRSGLCSALLFGFGMWVTSAFASPTLITAPDGTFHGKIVSSGTMRQFLGLRYAQPVTGSLRWMP